MKKVILFGGTSEGRELACKLSLLPLTLTVSVATDYGAELLEGIPGITVLTGRLDAEEMVGLFRREGYLLAVDATHPYATAVSQNIRFACREVNTPLLRLVREKQAADGAVTCKDAQEAAAYLKEKPGNILLTTGSKELEPYTHIPDYADRVFVRVLPTAEALDKCLSLGFHPSHIIAMQGPFGKELNEAIFRQFDIRLTVTKDGGAAARFEEKLEAAKACGVQTVVLARPEEDGLSERELYEKIVGLLEEQA